jgi:DNA-3-methyladenine glycosylase I
VTDLVTGADGNLRCAWSGSDELYDAYHDYEWGRGVATDRRLFEKIVLEGFQAGLAWITILRKRERFRKVFAGFDPALIAEFSEADVLRLLDDAGIIRHRGKIEATINNAGRALEMIEELGSIAAFVWPLASSLDAQAPATFSDMAAQTEASAALSKDLKKRGWKFVGPTTMYAFMQAMGLVNDHLVGCWVREACEAERAPLLERYR